MALSDSDIAQLRMLHGDLLNICRGDFSSDVNSFRSIINNLQPWVDKVAVGREVDEELQKLVEEINQCVDTTISICSDINNYCNVSERMNKQV